MESPPAGTGVGTDQSITCTKEEFMRGSSLIWTIVGVLLIIALLMFIL